MKHTIPIRDASGPTTRSKTSSTILTIQIRPVDSKGSQIAPVVNRCSAHIGNIRDYLFPIMLPEGLISECPQVDDFGDHFASRVLKHFNELIVRVGTGGCVQIPPAVTEHVHHLSRHHVEQVVCM